MKKALAGILLAVSSLTVPAGYVQAAEGQNTQSVQNASPRMVSNEVQREKSGRAAAAASLQKPKVLQPGDCIGIVGPATTAGDTDLSKAMEYLHKLG